MKYVDLSAVLCRILWVFEKVLMELIFLPDVDGTGNVSSIVLVRKSTVNDGKTCDDVAVLTSHQTRQLNMWQISPDNKYNSKRFIIVLLISMVRLTTSTLKLHETVKLRKVHYKGIHSLFQVRCTLDHGQILHSLEVEHKAA